MDFAGVVYELRLRKDDSLRAVEVESILLTIFFELFFESHRYKSVDAVSQCWKREAIMTKYQLTRDRLPVTLARLEQITAETLPLWGKMRPAQIMCHLRLFFEISLEEVPVEDRSNFITRTVIKKLIFDWFPYPKGIRVPARYIPEPQESFETERQLLIAAIKRFVETVEQNPERRTISGILGPIPLRYWAHIHGKHLDHHLRQLGV